MKGCNCSGNCKHCYYDEMFNREEVKDDNGQVIIFHKDFVGFEWTCRKYPERYKQFKEENGSKSSKWVMENVTMDCYEPTETQELMDDMIGMLKQLKYSLDKNKE